MRDGGAKVSETTEESRQRARPTATAVTTLLFEQMVRLNDKNVNGEALGEEVRRADAMCDLAAQIISNNRIQLVAWKAAAAHGLTDQLPGLIERRTEAKPGQRRLPARQQPARHERA